ncbi:MAG: hypothetical protein JNK72_06355 [Myxococcales bacterium]|nr:hypothetical protein [Myxococcales bacterium]
MRALGLAVLAALLGCDRGAERAPAAPQEALREWVRCSLDGVEPTADVAQLEGALRQGLRRDRVNLVVRGGRCEDSLGLGAATHPCLAPLKTRWVQFLTVAQRPGADAIALDMAVRHVGERYDAARRHCP